MRDVVKWIVFLAVCALLVAGMAFGFYTLFAAQQHWVAIHTGTLNESGPYYGFWSGFGSDIAELTLLSAILVGMIRLYRAHECHVTTCHRIATITTKNGHKLCHPCAALPHDALDLPEIHEDHTLTTAERSARDAPVTEG